LSDLAIWVQAGAALALVIFTAALAWWTRNLSTFTREYVELTRRALRVAQAGSEPWLVLKKDGRDSIEGGFTDGYIEVENLGGGLAEGVIAATSWGEAPLRAAILRPDEKSVLAVRIETAGWDQRSDKDPVPDRVLFRDLYGRPYDVPVRPGPDASTWVVAPEPAPRGSN
jgi:hypothetical protein